MYPATQNKSVPLRQNNVLYLDTQSLVMQQINYKRKKHHTPSLLLHLYRALLFPRLIEEKMLNQLRMNKISKWFLQAYCSLVGVDKP